MQRYDFENSIGFIVNRTAKAYVKALDLELHEKVGITVGQWKVIVMLIIQNGLTQKEIAEKLGLEGPTLIPIIDKMEEEGLVIRKVDSSDRRNNRIYYTKKVEALWDRTMECTSKVRRTALKDIAEVDINTMRTVLDKIWCNLRDEFSVSHGYNVDTTRISGNASAVKRSTVRHAALSSSTRRLKKNRS